MLLRSISLKNIRSYSNVEIEFKPGSTLLSGDIGSGKTTILLSIEFALFGIMRGIISGGALLRNGKSTGEVILDFTVENKQVTVMRALKKTSTGIVQDSGYVIINGIKTEGTAIELKSIILELLGYPEDLLTKSKTLIYRYTVYTPQEEMKLILYEEPEERLEKIRRLFDIDKYKRIKENASNYAKDIRSETKARALAAQGIDDIIKRITETNNEIKKNKELSQVLAKEVDINKKTEKKLQEEFDAFEQLEKKLQELKSQLKLASLERLNSEEKVRMLVEQLMELNIEIAELEKKSQETIITLSRPEQEIKAELEKYMKSLNDIDERITKTKSNTAVILSKKEDAKKIVQKIKSIDNCPTCGQKVTDGHKHNVEEENLKRILELEEKEKNTNETLAKIANIKESIKKRIDALREEHKHAQLDELKKKMQRETIEKIEIGKKKSSLLSQSIEAQKQKIISAKEKEKNIEVQAKQIIIDEKIIAQKKSELNQARNSLKQSEIKFAELKEKIRSQEQESTRLNEELEQKRQIESEIQKKRKLETWLTDHFINLIDTMEKHVLSQIHNEFSGRFEEWFKMLLEDEGMSVRLDSAFTPLIMQNGYETELENLSGGEKTSVALAYRLALNKVINDFMTTIKTRDIIILDEPTDGFSSEQLDKVRDVLEQLACKQTIIVSHEPKMESFVENIIRIRKNEHLSEIG